MMGRRRVGGLKMRLGWERCIGSGRSDLTG